MHNHVIVLVKDLIFYSISQSSIELISRQCSYNVLIIAPQPAMLHRILLYILWTLETMLLIFGIGQSLPGDPLTEITYQLCTMSACFVLKLFFWYSIRCCKTVTCACLHHTKYCCKISINHLFPRTQTCNLAVINTAL